MDAGNGLPGFAGLPPASMSSGSNVNNTGATASTFVPPAASQTDEPAAKRIKVEPSGLGGNGNGSVGAVANMAAIAASRAAGTASTPAVGSGMSTEQFLQALPAAYATKPPAFMVMLQQQQQLQQQAQRQQLLQQQQQQQQLQQHIQAQKQLQMQRHLQATGTQFSVGLSQPQQPQLQQSVAATPAQAQSQAQAQAIMMAAMAQNRLAQMHQQQQQQKQQQLQQLQHLQQLQQQRQQQFLQQPPVVKTEPRSAGAPPVSQAPLLVGQKKPQPTTDPACMVCAEKGEDLFVCSYGCGLAAHPRCIGEDMIVAPLIGGKICASCSTMQQDRNTQENLHKGGVAAISVRRAILSLNVETNAPTNFEKFGHLASLRLYEIAQVAGYPIAPFASKLIEPYLQRWIAEKLVNIASWSMNVRDVFTLMIGLYSLDRASICHGWRDKAVELIRAKNFSTTDFLGWHPAIEGPDVRCSSLCAVCCIRNPPEMLHCARCRRPLLFPTVFTKFVSALLASHYAEHVGISFGISFLDVFAHTHSVRGHYKGLKPIDPNGYDWEMFADQLRMIFGLLDIVSNFGVLELDPDLFDAEASIIFNAQYLNHAMILMEFETVGRFLQCMKLFGKQRADQHRATIETCEKFLIGRQSSSGSWCKNGSNVIDQYKATVVCAKALLNPVIRGRGPANPEQRRLLIKWAKKSPGNQHAKRAEQLGQGKILGAGVTVTGRTVGNLKKLELYYRRQIVPKSGLNSLEMLATARLQAIWSTQKTEPTEPQDDDPKDELTNATTDNEDTDAVSAKTDTTPDALVEEDDSLIKLSLSGELSLFDGLKFEDGDVIDISGNGDAADDDKEDNVKTEEEEVDAEESTENAVADEDQEDAEEDMYDDDDDAEGDPDSSSQLPEPDMPIQSDVLTNEIDVDAVDMSGLDGELQLDDSYAQNSMDLALDM